MNSILDLAAESTGRLLVWRLAWCVRIFVPNRIVEISNVFNLRIFDTNELFIVSISNGALVIVLSLIKSKFSKFLVTIKFCLFLANINFLKKIFF